MANPIDGTKAPQHGLFYMENSGGHNVEPQEAPSLSANERQSAVSPGKRKKGKIGRAAGD